MNRNDGEKSHDLAELVARALFQDTHRLRSWNHSKEYLKANAKARAAQAMKRAGIKNVVIDMEIVDPKEGAR